MMLTKYLREVFIILRTFKAKESAVSNLVAQAALHVITRVSADRTSTGSFIRGSSHSRASLLGAFLKGCELGLLVRWRICAADKADHAETTAISDLKGLHHAADGLQISFSLSVVRYQNMAAVT